jgi:serine/threonine protein kinase
MPRVSLQSVFPNSCPEFAEILDKLLQFLPRKRSTSAELLSDPLFEDLCYDSYATAPTSYNQLEFSGIDELEMERAQYKLWDLL